MLGTSIFFFSDLEDLPTHNDLSWGYNPTLHRAFIHMSCEFTLHSHLKVSSYIISTVPVQNWLHSVRWGQLWNVPHLTACQHSRHFRLRSLGFRISGHQCSLSGWLQMQTSQVRLRTHPREPMRPEPAPCSLAASQASPTQPSQGLLSF